MLAHLPSKYYHSMQNRSLIFLLPSLLLIAGCDGPAGLKSSLVGDWVGRAERAAERTLRDWPSDEGPKTEQEVEGVLPTDLEKLPEFQVGLLINRDGSVEMDLDKTDSMTGSWQLQPTESNRGILQITVENADSEQRRFIVLYLPAEEGEKDRFLLSEQGADPRYGRLLFERR